MSSRLGYLSLKDLASFKQWKQLSHLNNPNKVNQTTEYDWLPDNAVKLKACVTCYSPLCFCFTTDEPLSLFQFNSF